MALDTQNNQVWMNDSNRMRLLAYKRNAGKSATKVAEPLRQIRGPATGMMFIAGVAVDPVRREVFTLDNDIGDRMLVFPYDAEGNTRPKRVLHVPHQAWGISIHPKRDEVAISVQSRSMLAVYPREATGATAPLRILRGPHTGLADPHGISFDTQHNELVVSNHGNWTSAGRAISRTEGNVDPGVRAAPTSSAGGRFEQPSIRIYSDEAQGDTPPLPAIHGARA